MPAKSPSARRTWRDPDDAPELTAEMLARADLYEGETRIRRGRGRPAGSGQKVSLTVRIDRDIVETFRQSGRGWQTRINAALRAALPTTKARAPRAKAMR